MKEYICKDELLKRKRDINLANVPFNFIDVCPTITKADICREFAEKLQEYLLNHKKLVREIDTKHIYEAVKVEFISDIANVLEEMEQKK